MATIRISVDDRSTFSLFDVEGNVKADEIVAAMKKQYVAGTPLDALWDYSRAAFHEMDSDDYSKIANAAKLLAPNRPGGRTVFVAPGELEAVAIKLLDASSKIIDLPIPLHICATLDEAIAWLRSAE